MAGKYVPDGQGGFRPADLVEWAWWYESDPDASRPFRDGGRRVGKDSPTPGVEVSTVFLGMDHNFGSGPPLVFETMVFGGEHDQFQERYHTLAEAEAGHARAVEMVATSPVTVVGS